jgi:hypothetical protein
VDSKAVLWKSVSALMKKHYGKENLTQLAKDCKFGPGTSSRLKEQKTSVGLDVVDKIAEHFHVQSWQLLVQGFDPESHPTLQPLSERERQLYERWKEVAKEIIKQEH